MEVIILKDNQEVTELTANRIQKLIEEKKDAVLGLATGSTPEALYQQLVVRYQQKKIDFKHVHCFNLDEYVGVDSSNKASYAYYMKDKLYDHINIQPNHCHIPDGMAEDIVKECENYENKISQIGPIDLQLLGIGRDGHIGFNEPVSSLSSRTRLKTLTEQTRIDNAQYFEKSEVPYHVMTMGIGTILEAKEILLLAFGESKASAIAQAVEGPLTSMVPASALQLHNRVKVILDEKAASQLKNKKYYNWVYSQKPLWQQKEF